MLGRELLFKRRRTTTAAKKVGLPAYQLFYRMVARNKDTADWVLHHLFSQRPAVFWFFQRTFLPNVSKGPPNQVVEDDQQDEDQKKSIHSGVLSLTHEMFRWLDSAFSGHLDILRAWNNPLRALLGPNGPDTFILMRVFSPFSRSTSDGWFILQRNDISQECINVTNAAERCYRNGRLI